MTKHVVLHHTRCVRHLASGGPHARWRSDTTTSYLLLGAFQDYSASRPMTGEKLRILAKAGTKMPQVRYRIATNAPDRQLGDQVLLESNRARCLRYFRPIELRRTAASGRVGTGRSVNRV